MTPTQLQRIQLVKGHLEYLRDEWDESITEASLCASSAVLRLLLVHGEYSKAWRDAGFKREPFVKSVDMSGYLQTIAPEHILFAQRGGAMSNGMQVWGATAVDYAMTSEEVKARYQLTKGFMEAMLPMGVTGFMEQLTMLVRAPSGANSSPSHTPVLVSRRQIVNYVSNKLGGAHFDPSRNPTDKDTPVYIVLDQLFDSNVYVADKQAVYYELLAIGQAVSRSDDASKFLERARTVI